VSDSNRGRSVRLFLAEGSATGILTAEIMNWTGHVLSAPRSELKSALSREEVNRTGVYLLIGSDPEGSELPWVYVGESDEIVKRIRSHDGDVSKGDWEKFVCITSKDMNLTKAHVKYLEARLLDLLNMAKKSVVANSTNPSFDRLPESDISDMESFLAEIELVMPVIGFDALRRPKTSRHNNSSSSFSEGDMAISSDLDNLRDAGPVNFILQNKNAGIAATAQEIDGEFVILSGAIGSLKERESFKGKQKKFRTEALVSGRIEQVDDRNFELIQDIAFSSPSAASVFLFGTSRNGRTDWIEQVTKQNYGDWKSSLLESGEA